MQCADFESGRCRSCSELARPYAEQLQRKSAQARERLAGIENWLPAVRSPETGFRNKAKMAVGGSIDAPFLGLVLPGRPAVDLRDCPLYPETMAKTLALAGQWLKAAQVPPYDLSTRRGEAKFVLLTQAPGSGEHMLRFVLRSREALQRIAKLLPEWQQQAPLKVVSINLLPEHRAVTEGEVEIVLTPCSAIRCELNGHTLWLPPQAFFQTNSTVAAALYRTAAEWLDDQVGRIWDLYCGIGAFARHLERADREIVGIESSASAIEAANRAGSAVRFLAGDVAAFVATESTPDAAIVNPPRAGLARELREWLVAKGPQTLLYSSCNPDTLARDLKALDCYRPAKAQLFDMFPHTEHAEILVLLKRHAQ